MKRVILLLGLMVWMVCSYAENKTFIREYTYQASESDSKISARSKALTEVKKLLLEELGVYVESYVNYSIESQSGHITKDFITNEIKQMSVGITETKILEENWNGEQYFMRAEITADPTDVVRKINQTLEKRQSDVVIDSLHMLLTNMKQNVEVKNAEIEQLYQQLKAQTTANQTQQQKVADLNKQLSSLQTQLNQYRQEEQEILSEIAKIKKNLQSITTKAVTNARVGMTYQEVRNLCGQPRSVDGNETYSSQVWYNYGYIWLGFEDGILLVAVPVEKRTNSSVSWYMQYQTQDNYLKR